MPAREGVAVGAVEEHHRARRRLRAKRRALALDLLQRELPASAFARECILRERPLPRLFLEGDLFAVTLRLNLKLRRLVPARARQAAIQEDHAEHVVAKRDDLRAQFVAGKLALEFEVRPDGTGFGLG